MSCLKAGQVMTSRIPTPLIIPDNNTLLIGYCVWSGLYKNNRQNFSAIGGKTCLCAEVRSWKDGKPGLEQMNSEGTSLCR